MTKREHAKKASTLGLVIGVGVVALPVLVGGGSRGMLIVRLSIQF